MDERAFEITVEMALKVSIDSLPPASYVRTLLDHLKFCIRLISDDF